MSQIIEFEQNLTKIWPKYKRFVLKKSNLLSYVSWQVKNAWQKMCFCSGDYSKHEISQDYPTTEDCRPPTLWEECTPLPPTPPAKKSHRRRPSLTNNQSPVTHNPPLG